MRGKLHKINARAHNDGLVNTYFLQAEGTEFGKDKPIRPKSDRLLSPARGICLCL